MEIRVLLFIDTYLCTYIKTEMISWNPLERYSKTVIFFYFFIYCMSFLKDKYCCYTKLNKLILD